jgi:ABC-type glutathione transport system ATPase component
MLQRIAFAFQLGLRPQYILADEPTSALDEENREVLLELLRQQKKEAGILFVSHDYRALAEICDQMIVVHAGTSTAYSSFAEMLQNPCGDWTKRFIAQNQPSEKGGFLWKELC